MPAIAVYVMGALDYDSLWSPAIMVGIAHAWRTGLAEQGGTASFTLDAASLDACGLRWGRSVVEARLCGSALVGRLIASGTDTGSIQTTMPSPRRPLEPTRGRA
jgi:hypothetical protein